MEQGHNNLQTPQILDLSLANGPYIKVMHPRQDILHSDRNVALYFKHVPFLISFLPSQLSVLPSSGHYPGFLLHLNILRIILLTLSIIIDINYEN